MVGILESNAKLNSKLRLKLKLKIELSLAKLQILKRAPLSDIFFCVKNMPKMKYHADVIHSITTT